MNILAVVGTGLIAALLSIMLRQYKPEFSLYISLLSGIIILLAVIKSISPVIETMSALTQEVSLNTGYGGVLLKALAVCYLTQLATDTCKDAGETAIAAKVEMAGRIAIVLISMPLFKSLVEIVTQLIAQ